MFIGAINEKVRAFLALSGQVFNGRSVVVGCSGNFTSEAVLSFASTPLVVHSNDVSLYSCLAGAWLTNKTMALTVAEDEYDWLAPFLDHTDTALAATMVLLDMLEFEKRNNPHRQRMWQLHRSRFEALVWTTVAKLADVHIQVDSFFAGDVFDHFRRFEDDDNAVFCCYAPTYKGGYERLYKRLEQIIGWQPPTYEMLDDARRDELLRWMQKRDFVWYDDRVIEGLPLVMEQEAGLRKTVYVYSNLPTFKAFVRSGPLVEAPKLPFANGDTVLAADAKVRLAPIKRTDLSALKDMFLGKNIEHAQGMWGFVVYVGTDVVGCLEFARDKFVVDEVYMMADFAVSGTRYKKLSKLMVMLAVSGQTRRLLERLREYRVKNLYTTAFTDKPVSMKYRGVLQLAKRGQSKTGQKVLNYEGKFNELSWQETYSQWLTKHGSSPQ